MDPTGIRARLERFQMTWDPEDLWPSLTEKVFARSSAAIAEASAALLVSPDAQATLRVPEGVSPGAQGIVAFTSGMGPLLGYWLERGRLDTLPQMAAILIAHLDHGRRRADRLANELGRVLAAFAAAGVGTTLLKGAHLAHVYYPDPGVRPMTDIDLLIEPTGYSAAAAVLRAMHLKETSRSHHATTWCGSDSVVSLELNHVDNPWSLDLHTALDRPVGGGPTVSFAFRPESDTTCWDGVGLPVRVLRQPLLTWYLAVHVAVHFEVLTLLRLTDLVLVLRRDSSEAHWTTLLERLETTGGHRVLFPAMALVDQLVPGSVPGDILEELRRATPRRIRRVVDNTSPGTMQRLHRRSLESKLMWADSPLARLRWVVDHAWPRAGRDPLPMREAMIKTVHRLRRLARRRMTWSR